MKRTRRVVLSVCLILWGWSVAATAPSDDASARPIEVLRRKVAGVAGGADGHGVVTVHPGQIRVLRATARLTLEPQRGDRGGNRGADSLRTPMGGAWPPGEQSHGVIATAAVTVAIAAATEMGNATAQPSSPDEVGPVDVAGHRAVAAAPVAVADAASVTVGCGPAAGVLDLGEALRLAMANNREIEAQRRTFAIAREQVREARTHGAPRLNLQNLQTHVHRLTSLGPVSIGMHDSNISQVTLQQPLYTFGRVESGIEAARDAAAAERVGMQSKQADIALRVIQTYIRVLKQRNRAAISREAVALLQRHLELNRTLFDAGVVLNTDVATTKVKLLEARQKVIEDDHACAIARETLANLLVVPVETLGEPVDLAAGVLPGPASVAEDVGRVDDNPEVRRFDRLIRALSHRRRIEARGTLPTVGLQATWSTGNQFSEFYENWNAVVVVEMPLFEAGQARSRARQTEHEIARAEQSRELVRENLQLAKRTSLLKLRELEQKVTLALEAVQTARENHEQSATNYREGTVLNTDVLEAQLLLNDARVTLNNALYDYVSYQAEHARHVGRLGNFLRTVLGRACEAIPAL